MLIVNDAHFALAGVASLEERCTYCTRPLAAYPLVLSDDRNQTVYHITCAIQLASDLLADVFTFFSPPEPFSPLFVLTTVAKTVSYPMQSSAIHTIAGKQPWAVTIGGRLKHANQDSNRFFPIESGEHGGSSAATATPNRWPYRSPA
jgi:hypothetical protein